MLESLRFRVTGRVQGVFFRDFTRRAARERVVTGWVCNCDDGSVQGEAFGTKNALEGFVNWLHEGSPHSAVDAVEVQAGPSSSKAPPSFEIRY